MRSNVIWWKKTWLLWKTAPVTERGREKTKFSFKISEDEISSELEKEGEVVTLFVFARRFGWSRVSLHS